MRLMHYMGGQSGALPDTLYAPVRNPSEVPNPFPQVKVLSYYHILC
jgi:hypothetical protein